MISLAKPAFNILNFSGTYCALEGNSVGIEILIKLFTGIQAIPFIIQAEKKHLYHAAGVFAANYLVALAEEARYCLEQSGVEEHMIMPIVSNIMQQTSKQLQHLDSPRGALTGPIMRCDLETIRNHMLAFNTKLQRDVYVQMGLATLEIANLSAAQKCSVLEILRQK